MAFLAAVPALIGLSTAEAASIGAVTSAVGSVAAGGASLLADNYQAQIAANNAKTMQQNATSSLNAGSYAESMSRIKTGQEVGAAEASEAAGNVDVNSGTPIAVRQGIQDSGDLDALSIRYNAAMSAYGYQTEANSYTAQASMDRFAGINALIGGVGQGASSFLGASQSIAQAFGSGASSGGYSWTPSLQMPQLNIGS